MRKFLFITVAFLISFGVYAQKGIVNKNVKAIKTDLSKVKVLDRKINTAKVVTDFGVPIGLTNYDLQSNSSTANRLILHDDGTMSAVWIQDQSTAPGGSTRGTGYNYFNGTDWSYTTLSGNNRVENTRTGWGSIMSNGTEEYVSSHITSTPGFYGFKQSKGAAGDAWTAAPISGGPEAMLWPRSASSGNNYYIIGVDDYVTDQSEIEALHFYKSEDAGATWTYKGKMPNFNTYYHQGQGDVYQIDASGDNVAVVWFGGFGDTRLWKSTDKGETWTETVIVDFPVDNYDGTAGTIVDVDGDTTADTLMTTDGMGDVIIDNTGKVHVTFGRMRVLDEDAGDDGASSYFPYTDWVIYWNEDMGAGSFTSATSPSFVDLAISAQVDTIGWCPDLDDNGTLDFVDAGDELPFGKYFSSLSSFSSMGVDADNNIYVAFSTVMEGDNYAKTDATPAAQQFRAIFVTKRDAVTGMWTDPVDISSVDGTQAENVFPMMARKVAEGGVVHLFTQWDNEPGLHIRGDEDATVTDNYLIYKTASFPTSSVENVNSSNVNIYPNPTTGIVNVRAEKFNQVEVYNILGSKVISTKSNEVNIRNLSSGTYIFKIFTGTGIVTKKIQKM